LDTFWLKLSRAQVLRGFAPFEFGMGQNVSKSPTLQTCSHQLGMCYPILDTVKVEFPVQRVESDTVVAKDAQLIPSSRVLHAALCAKRENQVDRGMLAKAEWEKQLRAKIEARARERAELAEPEEPPEPEPSCRNDERQQALAAIQADMKGGQLWDRSQVPVLKEEDESTEEESTNAELTETSCEKLSSQRCGDSQTFTTQATSCIQDGAVSGHGKVEAFLSKHGFGSVNAKKRRFLRSTYPLHIAASTGDAQTVSLLLEAGAEKDQKNSAGQTAAQVALKANRKGSHRDVLLALGAMQ